MTASASSNTRKKQLLVALSGVVAIAALVVGLLLFGAFHSNVSGITADAATPAATPAPSTTTKPTPVPSRCAVKVHSFANDAPVGSNDFGPDQKWTDAKTGQKRLALKACSDSEFLATMIAYRDHGLKLDAKAVNAKAIYYVAHKAAWKKDATAYLASIAGVSVTTDSHTYQTLGMVPHGSKLPTLVRSDQKVVAGKVLVVKFKNGTVRKLRIICDLQPVEDTFPNVPKPPAPVRPTPPAQQTTAPQPAPCPYDSSISSSSSNCTPPPPVKTTAPSTRPTHPTSCSCPTTTENTPPCTCTTAPPPTSCGRCISPTKASEPVPTPATQATPVPTKAPKPLPSGPGGTQAPPTKAAPSGYNPVGGSAPGGGAGATTGPATTVKAPKPNPTPSQLAPTTDRLPLAPLFSLADAIEFSWTNASA